MKSRFWAALSMVAVAACARVIPHPANVTPIVAMALFSGAVFTGRARSGFVTAAWAIAIPLIAMFISDLALGFHDQMVSVYGSIVIVSIIGFTLSEKRSAGRVVAATLLSSVLFFAVTNFTVWFGGAMYSPTFKGLIECYTMALPFFRNAALGDLAFSGALFGAWAFVTSNAAVAGHSRATAKVKGNL